jgi:hypothetical protein
MANLGLQLFLRARHTKTFVVAQQRQCSSLRSRFTLPFVLSTLHAEICDRSRKQFVAQTLKKGPCNAMHLVLSVGLNYKTHEGNDACAAWANKAKLHLHRATETSRACCIASSSGTDAVLLHDV